SHLGRSPTAEYIIAILQAAKRNGYQIPTSLLSMYRALLTVESVAHELGSRANLRTVGYEFFQHLRLQEFLDECLPQATVEFALSALRFARDAPEQLNTLLGDLADQRFVLQLQTTDSIVDRKLANCRTRLVTAAILAVATTILLAGYRDQSILATVVLTPVIWSLLGGLSIFILVHFYQLR
ncbi:MAG: hypothetical protein JWN70_1475, partial [Planctomycetaceae bacterium]|nr:hypothetical protein [Planctomycetaceae bacterium]